MGETAPQNKREVVDTLADKLHFDHKPFDQIFDLREGKLKVKASADHEVLSPFVAAGEVAVALSKQMTLTCLHAPHGADASTARRYSTVTVLARLRGWSTFRPRLRAIL